MMRELAFSGRTLDGEKARSIGLVKRTFTDAAALFEGGIARAIAAKLPVAVRGAREMLRYMGDYRVDNGLEYIASWNVAMLQSVGLRVAMTAHMSKQEAEFAD